MEIKDFKKAMALQKELSAKLASNVDKLRKEKAPTIAATIREQERLIAAAKKEVADSVKEKELALKRWDARVEKRQATVAYLEKGLKEMKKQMDQLKKATRKTKPVPKAKK